MILCLALSLNRRWSEHSLTRLGRKSFQIRRTFFREEVDISLHLSGLNLVERGTTNSFTLRRFFLAPELHPTPPDHHQRAFVKRGLCPSVFAAPKHNMASVTAGTPQQRFTPKGDTSPTNAEQKEEWSGEEEDEDEDLEGDGEGSRKRKRTRTNRPISVSCEKCKERKVRLSW